MTEIAPNNSLTTIRLPFWETIRRSFLYVLFNLPTLWKIACLWFAILLVDVFSGYPTLCNIDTAYCKEGVSQNLTLSMVLLAIAAIAIMVKFSRFVILKEEPLCCRISFGKKELKYLGYALLLILGIVALGMLLGLVSGLFNVILLSVGLSPADTLYTILILLPVLLIVAGVVYLSRFYLIFPSVAVENKELGLKKSWLLTKGNACRIFFGQALLSIPTFVALMILSLIFKALGLENVIFKLLFSFLVISISFIDSALKASFFAHAYQYFIYFDKKDKAE